MRNRALLLGVGLLATLGAASQQASYPVRPAHVKIVAGEPCPGYRVKLQADGFLAGATVSVTARGTTLATGQAGAGGTVTISATVPDSGRSPLVVSGSAPGGGTASGSVRIRCSGSDTVTLAQARVDDGPRLPYTGLPLFPVAGVALVAVGAGAAALVVARRRRNHAA